MKRKSDELSSEGETFSLSPAVFELGAWKINAGFGGELCPQAVLPTAHQVCGGTPPKHLFGLRHLCTPNKGSKVQSLWEGDDFCAEAAANGVGDILTHTLEVVPEERPVMLVDPPHITDAQRTTLVETLFEGVGVDVIGMSGDAACATYAVGADKALVIDTAHRDTRVSVVYEGYTLHRPSRQSKFGSRDAVQNWYDLLKSQEIDPRCELEFLRRTGRGDSEILPLTTTNATEEESAVLRSLSAVHVSHREALRGRIVHSLMEGCADVSATAAMVWQLPDGQNVNVGGQVRANLAGVWFNGDESSTGCTVDANGVRSMGGGVAQLAQQSIEACEAHIRPTLCGNVVLKGGAAQQAGFGDAFDTALKKLLPSTVPYKRLASPQACGVMPDYTSWLGASILASTPEFLPRMVSKAEWEEEGATLVAQRLSVC